MSQEKKPVVVNRVVDGTQTFWHDRFKSDTKKMIKCIFNREDGQSEEDMKHIDHQHFFHSHDSNGRKQEQCVAVGGHYHNIITHDEQGNPLVDKQGRPRVECSKPYRKIRKRQGRKMVTIIEEVTFKMAEGKILKDEHSHVFNYDRSQELSPDKIQQLKRQNGNQMLAAFEGKPEVKDNTPAAVNAKDTASIR